jgi:hypothetical protein
MRYHWPALGAGIALVSLPLTACSRGNPQATQAQSSPASEESSAADITTTNLADANYGTPEQLEARKRGLAQESAEFADASKTGTVDPIAVDPYTRADYPDVVRKWGSLVPTINRERKLAAAIASKDRRCDGVANAQITDGGSRTNRHYMTECNNLTRIYFDAQSLGRHRSALVRTQADMGAQGVLDW